MRLYSSSGRVPVVPSNCPVWLQLCAETSSGDVTTEYPRVRVQHQPLSVLHTPKRFMKKTPAFLLCVALRGKSDEVKRAPSGSPYQQASTPYRSRWMVPEMLGVAPSCPDFHRRQKGDGQRGRDNGAFRYPWDSLQQAATKFIPGERNITRTASKTN